MTAAAATPIAAQLDVFLRVSLHVCVLVASYFSSSFQVTDIRSRNIWMNWITAPAATPIAAQLDVFSESISARIRSCSSPYPKDRCQ